MATARIIAGVGFATMLLVLAVLLCNGSVVLSDAVLAGLDRAAPERMAAGMIDLGAALTCFCGAQAVFMRLCCDALCPAAPMVVTGPMKAGAAVGAWGGLVAAVAGLAAGL